MFKETVEVALPSLESNVEMREERREKREERREKKEESTYILFYWYGQLVGPPALPL